jgi:uncharacterized membrane-anchored protein YitT (DUF2179 family)
MSKLLVGLGLVVMASAVAYFGLVSGQPQVTAATVNSAASAAFWLFLTGTMIAIAGGISARTRR